MRFRRGQRRRDQMAPFDLTAQSTLCNGVNQVPVPCVPRVPLSSCSSRLGGIECRPFQELSSKFNKRHGTHGTVERGTRLRLNPDLMLTQHDGKSGVPGSINISEWPWKALGVLPEYSHAIRCSFFVILGAIFWVGDRLCEHLRHDFFGFFAQNGGQNA